MKKYDYKKEMVKDIKDWILMNGILQQAKQEEWSDDECRDWLYDELWDKDCITGNGTYGYTPEDKCEEYVCSNLKLFFEIAMEWDIPVISKENAPRLFEKPAQYMDATIRCYLLGECIDIALEELKYE